MSDQTSSMFGEYTVHPVAAAFPIMPDAHLKDLSEDIKQNGLRQPIIVNKGEIIDGRNRFLACQMAGVIPKTIAYKGKPEDISLFIISTNLHRRQLTPEQRAIVAFDLEQLITLRSELDSSPVLPGCESAENPGYTAPVPDVVKDAVARIVGVEVNTKLIKELKKEAPGVFEDVRSGTKTLGEARRELKKIRAETAAESEAKENVEVSKSVGSYVLLQPDEFDYEKRKKSFDVVFHVVRYGSDDMTKKVFGCCKDNGAIWIWCADEHCKHILDAGDAAGWANVSWVKTAIPDPGKYASGFRRDTRHLLVFENEACKTDYDRCRFKTDLWRLKGVAKIDPECVALADQQVPLEMARAIVDTITSGSSILEIASQCCTMGVAALLDGAAYTGVMANSNKDLMLSASSRLHAWEERLCSENSAE